MAFVLLFSSCAPTSRQAGTTAAADLLDGNGTGARKTGMSKTAKGGLIGGRRRRGCGALLGRVIGGGQAARPLAPSSARQLGGTAGAVIGRKMDKQAEELQNDMANAKVERVGEGIKIHPFDSGILFDTNKADLRPASLGEIDKMAAVLLKYPDTNVLVEGHTDASGSDAINQPLSERRAQAVANEATAKGVEPTESLTKASAQPTPWPTRTPEGKQANRRVEVAIYADEKMKKAAEEGRL
ncbi:MAG: OmpA family protein [Hymenobacter sp.]